MNRSGLTRLGVWVTVGVNVEDSVTGGASVICLVRTGEAVTVGSGAPGEGVDVSGNSAVAVWGDVGSTSAAVPASGVGV